MTVGQPSEGTIKLSRQGWAAVIAGGFILVVAVISMIALAGDKSTDKMSPGTTAYVDSAMPALAHVIDEIQAGNNAQAALDWQAIGIIPVSNDADKYVATKYAAYMNDVRYYGAGDGSVNLQQLETAQTEAENAIAGLR
jgi:Uri superfamily endonuclease